MGRLMEMWEDAEGPNLRVEFPFHSFPFVFVFFFSFFRSPLLCWALHCRCSRCYFKCFLFAGQYFLFLFFVFVFQWIEWGTHYLHTATPPTAHFRPLWPAMNRLSSNANRFTVSYANFLSFFCSSFNLRFSLLFLIFLCSGHLPNAFASHILIYFSRGQQNFAQKSASFTELGT